MKRYILLAFAFLVQNGISAQGCAVSITGPAVVCAGFSATLTGFGAGSYTWTSSSFTAPVIGQSVSVGPGTYTLTGATGTCITSTVTTIGMGPPLLINASSSSGTTCMQSNSPAFSQPLTLSASGAVVYQWFSPTAESNFPASGSTVTARPPSTGCYTVVGATQTCSGAAVTCVTVIPQFSITVVPPLPIICEGASVQLSVANVSQPAAGPSSAFSYSWTDTGNTLNNNLTPVVIAGPTVTTSYTVVVYDAKNCISQPRILTVNVTTCTPVGSYETGKTVGVFPNPFSNELNIFSEGEYSAEVHDLYGKLMMALRIGQGNNLINTHDLPAGIYFLSCTNHSREEIKIKLVRN